MSHRDLTTLTHGELLWLERQTLGLTQGEMAARERMARNLYGREERDMSPTKAGLVSCHWKGRRPLSRTLLFRLARRRSELTLSEVASRNAVSKMTILKWERQGCDKLFQFWKRRGFTFGP